jgi:hypothetical protein
VCPQVPRRLVRPRSARLRTIGAIPAELDSMPSQVGRIDQLVVQLFPLRVNPAGLASLLVQLPVNPNDVLEPAAMVAL